jgi:hypothetical protein
MGGVRHFQTLCFARIVFALEMHLSTTVSSGQEADSPIPLKSKLLGHGICLLGPDGQRHSMLEDLFTRETNMEATEFTLLGSGVVLMLLVDFTGKQMRITLVLTSRPTTCARNPIRITSESRRSRACLLSAASLIKNGHAHEVLRFWESLALPFRDRRICTSGIRYDKRMMHHLLLQSRDT